MRAPAKGTRERELNSIDGQEDLVAPRLLIWARNTLRRRFGKGLLGSVLRQVSGERAQTRVRVVSATRLGEREFWKTSALGQSLKIWRNDPRVLIDVAYDNKQGLPTVYNAALGRAAANEAVLFIHDDVWLEDPQWVDKLFVALGRFDVVGVAGNTRRIKGQRSWLYTRYEGEGERFWLDHPHLSGSVQHGPRPGGEATVYGPAPARCELLDGVFIAVRNDVAARSGVAFDTRFDFHFYDLDFCRTARSRGLTLGTWPVTLTHQSGGAFSSDGWKQGLARYQRKWKR
jgi:GT2 family glycosyltransferase